MGLSNKDLLPDDLEDLVFDALRRANLPTHCVLIHHDAIVVQRKGGVIVVPVAVRRLRRCAGGRGRTASSTAHQVQSVPVVYWLMTGCDFWASSAR